MPDHASTDILMLSNTQARELAGRVVTIGGVEYSFQDYDPDEPGQPPWRTGAEGKAYCPLDIATAASAGDVSAAPYSDRYGRDMLILEFFLMGNGLPSDDPLIRWNREQLQRQFAAWRARSDPKCVRTLCHLDPLTVFDLTETERPASVDLAISLGLSLPERRVLRRVTELPRPAPATLGYRPTIAETGGGSRRSAAGVQRRGQRLRRVEGSGQPLVGSPEPRSKQEMSKDEWIAFMFILGLLVFVTGLLIAVGLTSQ